MALLKIIYFSHGWHLAKFDQPLVSNAFEAWKDGPVLRTVYNCFRDSGSKMIEARATKFNPRTERYDRVPYHLSEEQEALVRDVFHAYAHLDAFQLSDLTHESGSPWHEVWNAPYDRLNIGMRIPNDAIRNYFLSTKYPRLIH